MIPAPIDSVWREPLKAACTERTTSRSRSKTTTPPRSPSRRGQSLRFLEDIGTLIAHSHDLQETLEELTQTIAERMGTEVCSLYLFDPKERRLHAVGNDWSRPHGGR